MMTVKLFLNWLEKNVQKKFRQSPGDFPVCRPEVLRVAPEREFNHLDLIMPFTFLDLTNWARSRDFEQEVSKDSIYGFPESLIDLANYLGREDSPGPCQVPGQV